MSGDLECGGVGKRSGIEKARWKEYGKGASTGSEGHRRRAKGNEGRLLVPTGGSGGRPRRAGRAGGSLKRESCMNRQKVLSESAIPK